MPAILSAVVCAAAALQIPTAETGRRAAIGAGLAAAFSALPTQAALMPVCDDVITTSCRRPYKFTCAVPVLVSAGRSRAR